MTEIISAPQAASGAGVSRRRIMQGAAWAAPAIVIATAAPALAASGDTPTVTSSLVPSRQGNSKFIDVVFTVNLTVPPASTFITSATVIIQTAGGTLKDIQAIPAGWAYTSSGNTVTFTRSSTAPLNAPQSFVFHPRIDNPTAGGAITASFNASSGGGTVAASGSAVVPA